MKNECLHASDECLGVTGDMIISALKNIYKKMNAKAVHGMDGNRMPYGEQMAYLQRFPEPKDDFERSYFKYKCFCEYCYYGKKWTLAIYNLGAMLLLPSVYAKLRKANKNVELIDKVDAVIENIPKLPNTDVVPEELREGYSKVKEIEEIDYSEALLTDVGEGIYRELRRRYFFRFYFRMIVLQKLGQFCGYLKRYQPEAIAFYSCEREFSGPLQTQLCERSGAQYIAFMHGDYLSTLSFAFQKYSKYYVWDESYIRMFEALKCEAPMPVYRPGKLKGIARAIREEDCEYFATYYFSDETKAEATRIHEVFDRFEKCGLRTKIRPHPRFSDTDMLRKVFSDIEIEDPAKCSLSDSVTKSLYTVGLNTTVLSEAYFSGKKVAIDDISNPEKYRDLDARGYIMMRRPHVLLSRLRDELHEEYGKNYAFYKN